MTFISKRNLVENPTGFYFGKIYDMKIILYTNWVGTKNYFLGRYHFIIIMTAAFWVTDEVTVSLGMLSVWQGLKDLWVYSSELIANLTRAKCSFKNCFRRRPFKSFNGMAKETMGMVIKFMSSIRMFIMDPDQVGINCDSICVYEFFQHAYLKNPTVTCLVDFKSLHIW